MRVEVVGHSGDELVELRCGPVTFLARWDGVRPEVGSAHHVELDVAESIRWGRDIDTIDDPTAARPHRSDLMGQVITVSADRQIAIDILGTTVEAETSSARPIEPGQWVALHPGAITAYPYIL